VLNVAIMIGVCLSWQRATISFGR